MILLSSVSSARTTLVTEYLSRALAACREAEEDLAAFHGWGEECWRHWNHTADVAAEECRKAERVLRVVPDPEVQRLGRRLRVLQCYWVSVSWLCEAGRSEDKAVRMDEEPTFAATDLGYLLASITAHRESAEAAAVEWETRG